MLSGLIRMTGIGGAGLQTRLAAIMPDLSGSAVLEPASVQHIAGWRLRVSLPHQHEHRTLADCEKIIAASGMDTGARETALAAFRLVAGAEGRVHGAKPEEVHFHEVGALDSILDICLASQLFHELNPGRFVVSPLPVCDGSIACAHGVIPCPAPAVTELLEGHTRAAVFRGGGNGDTHRTCPSQSHGRGIRAVAGHADRAYGPRLWKHGLSRGTQWRALCLRCLILERAALSPSGCAAARELPPDIHAGSFSFFRFLQQSVHSHQQDTDGRGAAGI